MINMDIVLEDYFTQDHIQAHGDEYEDDWDEQRQQVLAGLRGGNLKLRKGNGQELFCPCQPTKKPYKSTEALLQHVDACSGHASHQALHQYLSEESTKRQADSSAEDLPAGKRQATGSRPPLTIGDASLSKHEIIWPPTVILQNIPVNDDTKFRTEIYDAGDIDAALGSYADQRRGKPKYFKKHDGIRGQGSRGIACVEFSDFWTAEELAAHLEGLQHGRRAWEQEQYEWQKGRRRQEVGHLYGWLATPADMQALDPKQAFGWKAVPRREMVTGEVQRLQLDRRRQMMAAVEHRSKARQEAMEASIARAAHQASDKRSQALQARLEQALLEGKQQAARMQQQMEAREQRFREREVESERRQADMQQHIEQRAHAEAIRQAGLVRMYESQISSLELQAHARAVQADNDFARREQELDERHQKEKLQLQREQTEQRERIKQEHLQAKADIDDENEKALELLRHMGIRITEFGDDLHQCSICNLDFNNVNGEHLRCQKCSDKLRQCKNCSKKAKEAFKENRQRMVLQPCGHANMCQGCVQKLWDDKSKPSYRLCPFCKKKMTSKPTAFDFFLC